MSFGGLHRELHTAFEGLGYMPTDERKIRTAEGMEYAFDTEEQTRDALPEYGDGATMWKRKAHRSAVFTSHSAAGWKQVT